MPAKPPTSPLNERIRAELELLVEKGLWEASEAQTEQLRSLSIFGGTNQTPAPLIAFRSAFLGFLNKNEELAGALSEMAIRLFGAEQPYRDMGLEGRLTAFGEVTWRGKTNVLETTRRRRGRRNEVPERITSAVVLAEIAAQGARPSSDQGLGFVHEPPAEEVSGDAESLRVADLVSEHRIPAPRREGLSITSRLVIVGSVAAVIAGLGLGTWTLWGQSRSIRGSTPPRGWAVDAADGTLVPPNALPAKPAVTRGRIAQGPLRECVVTGNTCLAQPINDTLSPTEVKVGDIVSFQLELYDPGTEPLSEIKLAGYTARHGSTVRVGINIEWPDSLETVSPTSVFKFTDGKPHTLHYMPATTFLYGSSLKASRQGRYMAQLPEGLFEGAGITLTDVGAPAWCTECKVLYIRYIAFSMRVV